MCVIYIYTCIYINIYIYISVLVCVNSYGIFKPNYRTCSIQPGPNTLADQCATNPESMTCCDSHACMLFANAHNKKAGNTKYDSDLLIIALLSSLKSV